MRIKRFSVAAMTVAAFLALGVPRTNAAGDAPQIHRGMTMAQVEKLYGEPDRRTETESGTTWVYIKGMSKAFIPFYGAFGHNIKTIEVTFRHSRVVSYSVEQ
jgi:hypothetical protein